jgi:autotransporter-associated beta strand protein
MKGRRAHLPALEALEVRITPSTATWTGAGSDSNWMTAANWSGAVAPQSGSDLVFPAGANNLNAVDDFPAGTSFSSITISAPGYSLSGNALELTGGISATFSSGSSTNAIPTALDSGTASVASGAELTLGGVISGSAGLGISGGGTLDLEAANTYTGLTIVSGSGTTLVVDGTVGAAQVNAGAVLGGVGMIGNVTSTGGTISPGDSPGILNTGSLTLDSNSTFLAELDGTTPGNGTTGYDQVIASGAINLAGAKLSSSIGGGYTPTLGDQLTIIHNSSGSGVTGTFANLPEGSGFSISGSLFRITYQGGSSHQDVVLRAVAATTTTTVSSSVPTSPYSQSVTFTAQVSGNQGTPTGTVSFYNGNPTAGGTVVGSGPVDAQGMASSSTSTIGVAGSPHNIFAVYIPDASSTYGGSTSTIPASLIVTPISLTVTGVTAQNKIYDSTSIATIDIGSAVLTGVLNGDQVSLNPLGYSASFNSPNVGAGKPVTVTGLSLLGSGATNYVLAQPTGLTATIAAAPLSLRANSLTILSGSAVPTLTFTATGLVGADTTTTAFTTQPVLTTTATSASPAGVYPIDISGGVAPNYTITQYIPGSLTVVTSTATTTTLTSSSNPAVGGQPVTFTAHVAPVSPSAGIPTGVVTFVVNGTAVGAVAVDPATGEASFTTSNLGVGANTILAAYSGDSVFQPSQTSPATQFVTTASTQTILTAHAVRNRFGRLTAVKLVTQVLITAPGTGVPTGSVTFFFGPASRVTVGLKNGTAVLKRAPLRVLGHFVFAQYSGNRPFQSSVSLSQVVMARTLAK